MAGTPEAWKRATGREARPEAVKRGRGTDAGDAGEAGRRDERTDGDGGGDDGALTSISAS